MELLATAFASQSQLQAKSTVTSSESLKPRGLMVKVRFFSLGQARNWTSTLNDTWRGGNVSLWQSVCLDIKCACQLVNWTRTVSPILRPEQCLTPGMTSSFRQVALKERLNSSGTSSSSSSILERIFCSTWSYLSEITVLLQFNCVTLFPQMR